VLLQYLRDRRRQRRLAVIDVTNRPNVAVRLIAIKFFLCHFRFSFVAPAKPAGLFRCYVGVSPATQINYEYW
jgi:hypothetical protein